MKNIVAISASPRSGWNTDLLVREAAAGAQSRGAEIEIISLYRLDKYTGCVSCFACKTPEHRGVCVYKDGLAPVLEKIRRADGLIIGTPNYLGQATAAFRALYERLVFQYITYRKDAVSCNEHMMPVLLIFTSNAPKELYPKVGYDKMIDDYKGTFELIMGPTNVIISADTLQVNNYEKYDWTMFDPEEKKARRETVFPKELEAAFRAGAEMCRQ
ncbi:MAG: flavodoxin family protein [Synergistes sp.]|nr:flavodoxin family protein [Synergistes sp.]